MSDENGHLFLVGFMGSGKSTIATSLGHRTGRPVVELDERIETRAGRSIADLFASVGENGFRQLETDELARLEPRPFSIVATGGGTFLGVANRRRMRELGRSVWLDVSLEDARDRVGEGADRPAWLNDDPLALRVLFERRRATYALADQRVLIAKKTPKTVTNDVLDRFERFFD